jgi:hypothetical protein
LNIELFVESGESGALGVSTLASAPLATIVKEQAKPAGQSPPDNDPNLVAAAAPANPTSQPATLHFYILAKDSLGVTPSFPSRRPIAIVTIPDPKDATP